VGKDSIASLVASIVPEAITTEHVGERFKNLCCPLVLTSIEVTPYGVQFYNLRFRNIE
jgi:hypothetical protein